MQEDLSVKNWRLKAWQFSSPQSQKPTKISEFVYDTNVELTEPTDTNDELTEPTVKEDYSWDSWKASNQGYLTAENFWQFLKDLAIHGKDVLYPCGIDATLIDEGKNVKLCGNNINFSSNRVITTLPINLKFLPIIIIIQF